ncbi:glucosaminidase domain-containing protein [Streptococcus parauberis]|uniref:glucosaminidase domain-containing protein n=1 Tax=Streptococcus parauberis TaxID=1348 RepID=UPI000789B1BA|nr:glucosaminidase domain-containing protein [Streptococcus parauberis]KYP21712.1 Mannosyl-glycoprotein endo-beta-N-acetylglucosaminidase [Streptococcus parauberis]KYP21886.1 Mannosyl-glycoprotein endo-beta-N-acetylglucosaminidase [Streptococcus parauberis]KYP21897.1 Mannosyl-glycoprotein endo-beta-N-acetylglucosaminidase [Streptococcus parauberis]KYP23777.1 Mannosyl-glycoprotein endo-beta-N-acetylglucosaminidase [Streptococcus parauberis]KYP25310.1 Mannosyl-glycoprotein endo-beta-N-acetylgluc
MLLTVHDSKMHKVAFLDNTKEKTLNYYEDMWIEDLVKVTNTFDFSIDKKELEADTVNKKAYQVLSERSFISFTFMGRKMLFNVMNIKERGGKIQVFCEDLNLELLNETVTPYEATTKMSFVDYCVAFNILNFGAITIGHNEIEDYERVLKWEGTENKHQRLISLARQFDAEIEFRTYLKKDSSLKSLVMNVYKKNDGKKHQGVGKRRDDIILINDRNVDDIERSIGKEKIKTMMTPTGKKTVDVVITKPNPKYVAPTARTVSYSGGGLVYAGRSISKSNVQALLTYCTQYKLLPSGVLSQLFVESFWGKSTVGQVDNNWGGMTWTGSTTRPSGVTVSRGMARPASEGGYYNHYASVADYFKDYTYLIAEQGLYKVKGKDSLEAFTKGLFREGGALYDYAAIGYKHYIYSMKDVRYNINRLNNKAMDNLDDLFRGKGTVGVAPVSKVASQTKAVLNEMAGLKGHRIGNGQCYGLSAWYAMKLGGAGLNGGVTGFRGLRPGGGSAASQIGEDYNWSQFGWKVVVPSKVEHLIAGSIANIRANAGGPVYTGAYGHTVTIKSLSGDTLTVYEQNFAGHQYVEERTYGASAYLRVIQTLVYPPEIVQGKRVEATATTAVTTTPIVESGNNEPKTISETQQKEKITTIDPTIYREWKNAKGEVEFYLKNGSIYAPLAKELYPSVLSGEEVGDDWLKERMELETDDQEILITEALEALKKICYPALTYDVDAYEPSLNAGDTIKIVDRKFHPTLTLEARATRQERSFTAPSKNKTKFDNYRALESKMPASLQSRYEELNELAKPYDLRLITSNGQTFKNGIGSSVITAEVWKNNKLFDATFQFKNVDTLISSGLTCLINANEISETYVVTIEAYIGNEFIASKQLTFSNVNDGQDGIGINSRSVTYGISTSATVQPTNWTEAMPVAKQGEYLWKRIITDYTDPTKSDTIELTYNYQGKDGTPGTSLTVSKTEYQAGTSGTVAPTGTWTIAIPTVADGQFLWMKATMSDNSTIIVPTKQGAKGKDGISITNTVTTNALATSGTTAPTSGWSATMPTLIKGQFLWTKIEMTLSDGTTKTSYFVTYIPNDGINGQTPVVHTAYANSQNGAVDFSITDSSGRRFIGQYVDYSTTNSTDYTKYKWVDMVGSVQVGGVNLASIVDSVDNRRVVDTTQNIYPCYFDNTYRITKLIPCKKGDVFTLKNHQKVIVNLALGFFDSNNVCISRPTGFLNAPSGWSSTYTIPDNVVAIAVSWQKTADGFIKLEKGNIATDYSQAPEDIDAKIDAKADQLLTQQQILALEEKTTLARENAIAEAMQNTISEVEQKWQLWYDTNTKDEKQQVANDIASLMQRTAELDLKLGEASAKFSFINNETIIGEDGVAIGDKAGKAKLFMSGDSISFLTNGVAQMTLTGDTLSIKNGLFTERIQIGNFVEEVYDKNPLFNVIRSIKNS